MLFVILGEASTGFKDCTNQTQGRGEAAQGMRVESGSVGTSNGACSGSRVLGVKQ